MRYIIRVLWCIPMVLVALGINQAMLARNMKATWEQGLLAVAAVTEHEQTNRADVNFGYISLLVSLDDGSELAVNEVSLPYTLLPRLVGRDSVAVRVLPGAPQEVVIVELMPTHLNIVLAQIGFCALGTVLFLGGLVIVRRRTNPGELQAESELLD